MRPESANLSVPDGGASEKEPRIYIQVLAYLGSGSVVLSNT